MYNTKKHIPYLIKNIGKNKHHYTLGALGIFAVIKSFIFIFGLLASLIFTQNTSASSPLCMSRANTQLYEWITRVKINNGEQITSKTGYIDYTDYPIANLTAGTTYPVEVDVATDGSTYQEYVKIWLDMDQNNIIGDTEELVFNISGDVTTLKTFTGNITIPETAFNGHIYMRIIMQYNATPNLCGSYPYGGTQDYLINLRGGTSNPANNTLTVSKSGNGFGHIISSPSGIDTSGGINNFDFFSGDNITLTALADIDSTFSNRTGDCTGINTDYVVNMDTDNSCTAIFTSLSNGGGGTCTSGLPGQACLSLEITAVTGECRYGVNLDLGDHAQTYNAFTMTGTFLSNHISTTRRSCNDTAGKAPWSMQISSTNLLVTGTSYSIANTDIEIKTAALTKYRGSTSFTGLVGAFASRGTDLSTPRKIFEKTSSAGTVGEIGTDTVDLRVLVPTNQEVGAYQATLTIAYPQM
ncbi:MAG: GEVED domain-containing protein [Candidatus Absconditicoccaceae bacterium]